MSMFDIMLQEFEGWYLRAVQLFTDGCTVLQVEEMNSIYEDLS